MARFFIGSDHGGFVLKQALVKALEDQNIQAIDVGAASLQPEDDYPDFAEAMAAAMTQPEDRGVLLCRSGGGMAIAANRFPHIRAVQVRSEAEVVHAREHNGANVITLAADEQTPASALLLIDRFLHTVEDEHPRHQRRRAKLTTMYA